MAEEEHEIRARVPTRDKGEMFAVVEQRLGYNKMYVRCEDGRIRIGRVPGRYARRLWIKEGDLVIVEPWPIQGDKKCDIVYRYTPAQIEWLRSKNLLPSDLL